MELGRGLVQGWSLSAWMYRRLGGEPRALIRRRYVLEHQQAMPRRDRVTSPREGSIHGRVSMAPTAPAWSS